MKQKEKSPIQHSIRRKIFLVSLMPTVALLVAAILNNQYLSVLGESAEQILSKNYKSIRTGQEARKELEAIRNQVLEQVQMDQEHLVISTEDIQNLSTTLNICRDNITEAGEHELIERLDNGYGRLESLARSLSDASNHPWTGERFTHFLKVIADMVATIDDLVAINEKAMEHAEEQTRSLAHRAQGNAAVLFGIIIAAILALSYFLSYRIARPIMTLAHELSKTKEGVGNYPAIPLQTKDEIGFLTDSFNRLFSRLEQYDHHRDDTLAAEREKVRRSEEAKGRFIADISHQLKTPMTSLAMSVGMLHSRGDGLNAQKRATLISTAHDDCNRLTALINELVDISRLETLSRPRPKETLDISMVIRECLVPLIKQAEYRGVFIETEIPKDVPKVTIDSFRFPWVITNLVGNALRYTDRGGRIVLKVFIQGSRFYFQCMDTGSGIDPKFIPHVFDRFAQFSERGKSGTIGLGLAIVKDIIEQHGGDIQVQSQLGKGTTFTFWIPASEEKSSEKGFDH